MNNQKRLLLKYVGCDYLAANLAWMLYTFFRYLLTEDTLVSYGFDLLSYMTASSIVKGQIIFPVFILFICYLSGYYNNLYFKSRLQEFLTTAISMFVVSIILFFTILINDSYPERTRNYELILVMWAILTLFVYLSRYAITRRITQKIHCGEISFTALILGYNAKALQFANRIKKESMGYRIIGFVKLPNDIAPHGKNNGGLPVFHLGDLDSLLHEHRIQAMIIVSESQDRASMLNLINKLFKYDIPIKIMPELYDIITTRIQHSDIIGEPLIDIAQSSMPEYQKCIKRTLDVLVSAVALLLLSPVFLFIGLLIKKDSSGPVFYKQERIGKHGKPFCIYKFRTMVCDAEKNNAPQLSSQNDKRITKIGKTLRKYRLDETPQFWNVVKGDMSIVGPRPERNFFAEQIIRRAPYYTLIYQVRPGITSWGMVKYGYAINVEGMIERAKYDLIYIENMSLLIDLKIITHTVKTVFTGKGM